MLDVLFLRRDRRTTLYLLSPLESGSDAVDDDVVAFTSSCIVQP